MDSLAPNIIQSAAATKEAIKQVRKIRAKNQVIDVLNTKNGPLVDLVNDLSLNSDILVWQKGNAGWTSK